MPEKDELVKLTEGWAEIVARAAMEKGLKLKTEVGVNGATEEKSWVKSVDVDIARGTMKVELEIPLLDWELYKEANGVAAPKHLRSCKQYQDFVEVWNQ